MPARRLAPSASPTRRRTHERVLAKVPDQWRWQIDSWAESWIKQKFARGLALHAADLGPFNYPVEVFSEWRGKAFTFAPGTAHTPAGPRMISSSVARA